MQFDPDRKRIADLKVRYETELRQAQDDVKQKEQQLIQVGGAIPAADSSPKSMELNRRVQEQIELKTQKLAANTEFTQLADKKSQGGVPPTVAQSVEHNADLSRARESVASLKSRLDDASATKSDTNPEVVSLKERLATAQKELDQLEQHVTVQCLKDYEDELNWRRDNLAQRLSRVEEMVAQLKQEVADINLKTADLDRRKEDAEVYRELGREYSRSLQDLDEKVREAVWAAQTGGTSQPAKPPGN